MSIFGGIFFVFLKITQPLLPRREKKSLIEEKLNLSMCADNSNDTKANKNLHKGPFIHSCFFHFRLVQKRKKVGGDTIFLGGSNVTPNFFAFFFFLAGEVAWLSRRMKIHFFCLFFSSLQKPKIFLFFVTS